MNGSFDAAWALDDRPLSATALAHLLRAVDDDIHVVMISNCCHGAGMFDGLEAATTAATDQAATSPDTGSGEGTNRVLVAACHKHQGTLLTSESTLTGWLLEQLFPVQEGARRPRAVDYARLSDELADIASTAQTPVVRASAPDLRREAFAAQPRARGS